jgi:hypothetical protein
MSSKTLYECVECNGEGVVVTDLCGCHEQIIDQETSEDGLVSSVTVNHEHLHRCDTCEGAGRELLASGKVPRYPHREVLKGL